MVDSNERIILGIDPGEILNGLAIFKATSSICTLVAGRRPPTDKLGELIERIADKDPIICYELYRVYNSKLSAHRFSRVRTIESIGMLEYLIKRYGLKSYKSMAVNHKLKTSPVTKDFMLAEGYWGQYPTKDADHIRDATRVGLYWWKHQGILNNGKYVVTDWDRQVLGIGTKATS